MDNAVTPTAALSSMQMMGDIAVDQASTARLRATPRNMQQIDKTSQDFEGMFMSQMLQPMFEHLETNSTFGGGHGEEVMRSLLVQEYGKIASKRGGIGIADAVKREMIRAQNLAQGKDPNAPLAATAVNKAAARTAYTKTLNGGNYDLVH